MKALGLAVIAISLGGVVVLVKGRAWTRQGGPGPLLLGRLLDRLPDPLWTVAYAIITLGILGLGVAAFLS